MSKKFINSIWILALSLSLFGCKDFIEKNISEETPVLILPANNSTINANPIHIKWEETDGATKYHIEIVSPEFGDIQSFPVDSLVTGTNFYIGLDSAQYEIRITAVNAGYSSKQSEIKRFWVGTSQGGANSVNLLLPEADIYESESFDGKFSWSPITALPVSGYTFELHKTNSFSGAYVINPINQLAIAELTIPEAAGSELPEGVYCWGVKAYFSNGGETNFSKRIFYIDKTAPGNALLTAPASNATIAAGTIDFSWTLPTNPAGQSPIESKIEIATDNGFLNLVNADPPEYSTAVTHSETMTAGTYYWRVIVRDEAGHVTTPATPRTLTLF